MSRRKLDPLAKFWSKVDMTGDCWIWTGARNSRGYGNLNINGKSVLAHRFAYELEYGLIPEGDFIRHKCLNNSCVRPDHMLLRSYQRTPRETTRITLPDPVQRRDPQIIAAFRRRLSKIWPEMLDN